VGYERAPVKPVDYNNMTLADGHIRPIHTHTHTHTYIHTYIHTYTHAHTYPAIVHLLGVMTRVQQRHAHGAVTTTEEQQRVSISMRSGYTSGSKEHS